MRAPHPLLPLFQFRKVLPRGTRGTHSPLLTGHAKQGKHANTGRGFTLVELLVVIVVIGVLAAIAIPVFLSQADKASDTALKSDLANAAKLLQVAEANGETLPTEFAAGEVVDLGSAGTFTASETLTVTGSGETLCVEGQSDSGKVFSADLANGLRNYDCAGRENGWQPMQASGGDNIYTIEIDGVTYRVHEFTTVGESTFTVTEPGKLGEVEYLIVAGGGGASNDFSGGGGGGGVLRGVTDIDLDSFTITVGEGGLGGNVVGVNTVGQKGGNSSAFDLTAIGGGVGGLYISNGESGGSGGGGGARERTGGNGTSGQGNEGGAGNALTVGNPDAGSGGGGGAGEPGGDGSSSNGGDGVISEITGAAVFYGGGGGGGVGNNRNTSTGGAGGGGDGAVRFSANQVGGDGIDGLGGGGGGTGGIRQVGGSGGSGIVIVRYPITDPM